MVYSNTESTYLSTKKVFKMSTATDALCHFVVFDVKKTWAPGDAR